MPKLKLVEKGIRRVGGAHCNEQIRLPVTPDILRRIKALWVPRATEYNIILQWAVCCTAFFGFFRLGELLAVTSSATPTVSVDDVAVDNVHQTDQFGTGVTVVVGATD